MSVPLPPAQPENDPFAPPTGTDGSGAALPGAVPTAPTAPEPDPYAVPEAPADGTDPATDGAAPAQPAGVPGPPPGTDLGADLSAALGWAWAAFTRNWVAFVVAGAVWFLVELLIIGGAAAGGFAYLMSTLSALGPYEEPGAGPILILYAIVLGGSLLAMPFSLLWQAGTARAAQDLVEGRRPTIGHALVGPGRLILTALIDTVLITVGMMLCYLPGFAASVFLMLAMPAAASGASPIAAIKESFALVKKNFATVLITWLLINAIAGTIGALGFTVIAIVPLTVLIQMGLYHRLRGTVLPEPRTA